MCLNHPELIGQSSTHLALSAIMCFEGFDEVRCD